MTGVQTCALPIEAVHKAVAAAVAQCRAGKGPVFIEAVTQRWEGSKPMWPSLATGITDVAMAWEEKRVPRKFRDWYLKEDPILLHVRRLLRSRLATREAVLALDGAVNERMAKARRFAIDSPMPDPRTVFDHVFGSHAAPCVPNWTPPPVAASSP